MPDYRTAVEQLIGDAAFDEPVERCNVIVGYEQFNDSLTKTAVYCLLPAGHNGNHADWTAWLGVKNPDFSRPGASNDG